MRQELSPGLHDEVVAPATGPEKRGERTTGGSSSKGILSPGAIPLPGYRVFEATMSEEERNEVVEHLEAAVEAAQEVEMPATELAGLLFFYAHNVAQEVREVALAETEDD